MLLRRIPCSDVKKPEVRKKYAIVAVATGKGLINAFKEMGADYTSPVRA